MYISQVDLLLSFCSCLGLSSVVLVGHDDGGLLALKAVEKVRTFDSINVRKHFFDYIFYSNTVDNLMFDFTSSNL